MSKIRRDANILNATILSYLERNSLRSPDLMWEIRRSPLGGFGVFATRPIQVGEMIFKDFPVIFGPRAASTCPILCVTCYKEGNLQPCRKGCYLQFCSAACQNSPLHQKECKLIRQWISKPIEVELLTKVLTPIRSLLLSFEDKRVVACLKSHKLDNNEFEVNVMKNDLGFNIKEDEEDFMRFACSVLNSNAFEVLVGNDEKNHTSVRGLYPLGSLANHCCSPNTIHVFDENRVMITRACKFINEDAEIFHSYTSLTWGTSLRRLYLLKSKHFWCKCDRCKDPAEFGAYLGSILCKVCKGPVVSMAPLDNASKWHCETCGQNLSRRDVAMVTSLLNSTLNSLRDDDLEFLFKFLEVKLPDLVPQNNETVVKLKYRLIWILGYSQGYAWPELPENLLLKKEQYCLDLLSLLKLLHLGRCRMRGLLLFELYCCRKENKRREEKSAIESKVSLGIQRS